MNKSIKQLGESMTQEKVMPIIYYFLDSIKAERLKTPGSDGQHIIIVFPSIKSLENYNTEKNKINFLSLPLIEELARLHTCIDVARGNNNITCITINIGEVSVSSSCIKL